MCIFCKIVAGDLPSARVYEDDHVLAFLDVNPMTPYHTLVIPKKHVSNILETAPEELQRMILIVQRIAQHYQTQLGLNDFQILNNCGAAGQQSVFHVHFHIIPRTAGDGKSWKASHESFEFSELQEMARSIRLLNFEN